MVDELIIGIKGKLTLSIAMYLEVVRICRSLIVQGDASPGTILVLCEWEKHLQKVCFAYNTSVHISTGQTPFS